MSKKRDLRKTKREMSKKNRFNRRKIFEEAAIVNVNSDKKVQNIKKIG